MKRACLIAIFVFGLGAVVPGQDTGKDACPRFHLLGPSGIFGGGRVMPFFVRWVDATGELKLAYRWKVAGGKLVGGQATQIAEVKTPRDGNVTVFVEISGLPSRCANTATETLWIDPPPVAEKLEEYTGPLTRIPKSHLERILGSLRKNPGSALFVIISGGGKNPSRSIRAKRNVLERDLFSEFEGTPPVTIIEYISQTDDKLEIWLVPPGATPPIR